MYSEKTNQLKKITEEQLLAVAKELPESPDGKNAAYEVRYELRGNRGELLSEASDECTFFGELIFTADGLDKNSEMVFSFSLVLTGGEYSESELDAALDSVKADIKKFYLELEGNSHCEYFKKLSEEREAELMPKEEEKSPFNYKKFMIYASLAAVAVGLLALLIGKVIPALLG